MPGAPNRPPERTEEPAPAPPAPTPPERLALRRLVPSHVALLLDSWKGGPAPELMQPFEKAEAAYRAGDYAGALSALDLLSIRFAEPRWPSLPAPFRELRVPIPAPMPPHWNPEHGLAAEEREARRARRTAEEQLALADGAAAWASGHGVPADDLRAHLATARSALAGPGVPPEFYGALDPFWSALVGRLPRPRRAGAVPAPAADAPGDA
ncbi:MAG TPA: hypothetical protein VML53_00230 [Thermoplasmata archaeon]|nr:hypothetical protein [Thermoplasmata archaeon]